MRTDLAIEIRRAIKLQSASAELLRLSSSNLRKPPLPNPVVNRLPALEPKAGLRLDNTTKMLDYIGRATGIHDAQGTRPCTAVSNRLDPQRTRLRSMAKTTLPQRLQTIMDAMQWSQAELARAAKCSRGSVTNWMTGISGRQNIEPKFAFNLADATRFNARWIIYGDGPARMDIADPDDARLLGAISKLPPERKRVLLVALGL